MRAFPYEWKLKRWYTYTPRSHRLPAPSPRPQPARFQINAWVRVEQRNHRVPRAPLPEVGVTHHRGGFKNRLRRHYSSFFAHTDSCVRPNPSRCLGMSSYTRSLQVVTSPCWAMALPDIISAILAWALGPIPRHVPRMLALISSPRTTASPYRKGVRHVKRPL